MALPGMHVMATARWMMAAAAVLLAAAPAVAQPLEAAQERLAVFPIDVQEDGPSAKEHSAVLTSVFTARVAAVGAYRVVSASEIQDLLNQEGQRQGLGVGEDSAAAEIAGALGAALVLVGSVQPTAKGWVWTATLERQPEGTEVRRAVTHGRTLQSLMAQADEVALEVLGRQDATLWQGKAAQERLGMTSDADLAAFKTYRSSHAELTTQEALTAYIVSHNMEHKGLAAAQAVLLLTAAVLPAIGFVGLTMALAVNWLIYRVPDQVALLGFLPLCGALLLVPLSMLAGVGGLSLAVLDGFNLGRVTVKSTGCCRNDAEIAEADRRNGFTKALATAILLSGPLAVFLPFPAWFLVSAAVVAYPLFLPPQDKTRPAFFTSWLGIACLAAGPCVGGASMTACCFNTPIGLMLLAWPSPDPVEDVSRPTKPAPPAAEAR